MGYCAGCTHEFEAHCIDPQTGGVYCKTCVQQCLQMPVREPEHKPQKTYLICSKCGSFDLMCKRGTFLFECYNCNTIQKREHLDTHSVEDRT